MELLLLDCLSRRCIPVRLQVYHAKFRTAQLDATYLPFIWDEQMELASSMSSETCRMSNSYGRYFCLHQRQSTFTSYSGHGLWLLLVASLSVECSSWKSEADCVPSTSLFCCKPFLCGYFRIRTKSCWRMDRTVAFFARGYITEWP